jgi:hypothetical protein
VKLINRTLVSSAALHGVLAAAGRMVGARTAEVVVCVSRARRGFGSSGTAYHCAQVRWAGRRWTATDGGAFKITLPVVGRGACDPLDAARFFFRTAAHEWCHIREYQMGGRYVLPWSSRGPGGRRPKHDARPEERRVYLRLEELAERGKDEHAHADEVLALALALEEPIALAASLNAR